MRQKPLTKEQREMLENSPYVMKLTDVYVFFKSSFINKFCVDYHAGKTADSIFLEAGIDPKILGKTRVDSLRRHYYKNWLPKHMDEPVRKTITAEEANNAKMRHEIEYLRQEVNALKKIIHADFVAGRNRD